MSFTVDQIYRHVFVVFPEQFPVHSCRISNPADFLKITLWINAIKEVSGR